MSYYERHREERIIYQSYYNIINIDKYKSYQKDYALNQKDRINKRKEERKKSKMVIKDNVRKPLKEYHYRRLETMLRRKLKEYNACKKKIEMAYKEKQKEITRLRILVIKELKSINKPILKPINKDKPIVKKILVKENPFVLSFD